MRQRVMIAMALACDPKLLIADEPTTALDVTIQAQILDLMRELKAKTGTAIMLITHDLGVVAEMAQRVVVMYAGRKVEEAPVGALFAQPRHPYTQALLGSVPRLGSSLAEVERRKRLAEIPGVVPSLTRSIAGCIFAPRCAHATERCRSEYPPLEEKAPGHWAACWEADRLAGGSAHESRRRSRPARCKNLTKHFPVRRGLLGRAVGQGARRRRHLLLDRAPARRSASSANPAAASPPPAS